MLQRVTTEVNAYIWTPLWRVCVDGRRRGRGSGLRQKWDVIQRRGLVKGVSRVLDVQSLFFLLKKIGFAPWADIMLLTRNLSFDSSVRQWSFPLMIPLHCFWAKSNNRKRDKCERDVTQFWFLFCICSFSCTVRLLFHSLFTFSGYPNKKVWLQNEY